MVRTSHCGQLVACQVLALLVLISSPIFEARQFCLLVKTQPNDKGHHWESGATFTVDGWLHKAAPLEWEIWGFSENEESNLVESVWPWQATTVSGNNSVRSNNIVVHKIYAGKPRKHELELINDEKGPTISVLMSSASPNSLHKITLDLTMSSRAGGEWEPYSWPKIGEILDPWGKMSLYIDVIEMDPSRGYFRQFVGLSNRILVSNCLFGPDILPDAL